MAAGLYIHVPFCMGKCPYCDFYSLSAPEELRERYVAALENQIAALPSLEADTIYFGGGTPSLLAPGQIYRLLEALYNRHRLSPGCEVTLECNPASVDRSGLSQLRAAGVNRLSVGAQSLDDRLLRLIGRRHTAEEARATLCDAAAVGFDNLSADLMLGLPGEGGASATASARELTSLCGHISAYMLKIMEGTPFASGLPDLLPGDDRTADIYLEVSGILEGAGLARYEISNFARPGLESCHNLKYWDCGDWLGYGPAAHSCLEGRRYSFPRDLTAFLARWEAPSEDDPLSGFESEGTIDSDDYIMLRLRTAEGLSRGELFRRFGAVLSERAVRSLPRLAAAGYLSDDGRRIALTGEGLLVSNSIILELCGN